MIFISLKKRLKFFAIICLFVWIFITFSDKYLNEIKPQLKSLRPNGRRTVIKEIQDNNQSYIILFWTKYFHQNIEYYFNNKTIIIDSNHCSGLQKSIGNQCVITSDRAYLSFSKALVFHWRDINTDDFPAIRRSDQLWTLYNLEAPTHTSNIFRDNQLLFNITSSFRSDSDIYVPYGRVTKSSSNSTQTSLKTVDFKSKTKLIVWFVSNCETPSGREAYVRELGKYIPIDIYGKCGHLVCEPPRSDQCFQRVAKEYKFYLSFENSICRDYVTEKLFEALNYDILPVVFGGADYNALMPSKSFIDANRLTPKQLAIKLKDISNNINEYLSYFEWKTHFRVESGLDIKFELFCHLCQKLNSNKTYLSHSSAGLSNWWFNSAGCKTWVGTRSDKNHYLNKIYANERFPQYMPILQRMFYPLIPSDPPVHIIPWL